MNLKNDGKEITRGIKTASWFPFHSGNLKFNATNGDLINANTFLIKFDSGVADYIESLENGSQPHDIPRAFGKPLPFGIGGNFDGKFHPGSQKHKGFISNKTISFILNYYITKYQGEVK